MNNYSIKDIEALAQLQSGQSNNNFVNIDGLIYRAHVLRSQYITKLFSGLYNGVVGGFLKSRELAAAKRHLYAMSDHELKDLGITRSDIENAVEGVTSQDAQPKRSLLIRGFKAIAAKFVQAQEARAAYAVLMAMSSRELSDIGLTRGEINTAVHGGYPRLANDNRVPQATITSSVRSVNHG